MTNWEEKNAERLMLLGQLISTTESAHKYLELVSATERTKDNLTAAKAVLKLAIAYINEHESSSPVCETTAGEVEKTAP